MFVISATNISKYRMHSTPGADSVAFMLVINRYSHGCQRMTSMCFPSDCTKTHYS